MNKLLMDDDFINIDELNVNLGNFNANDDSSDDSNDG